MDRNKALELGAIAELTTAIGSHSPERAVDPDEQAVATDNAALTTTEDDIVNGATGDLAAGVATPANVNGTGLALDGSSTPADAHLNVAFAADDHGANAGELTVAGTVTILWSNLGDD